MSRLFDPASSQYLENTTSAPVTSAPLTLAAWVYVTQHSAYGVLCVQDKDSGNNWFQLRAKNSGVNFLANFWVRSAAALPEASSTITFSTDSWHHLCAIEYATNSRAAFLDGGNKGANVTACTPAGMDSVSIGRAGDSTPGGYMEGRIAEAGVWDVALTDAEVAALAGGVPPSRIRPESLVAYWPVAGIGSPEPDYRGTYNLTLFNAPTTADHASAGPMFGL